MEPIRVAVIGAGMAGLSCAEALAADHITVTLFEKSRGPGGRMASARTEHGPLDIGAQYFRARDPRFQQQTAAWREQGLIDVWESTPWIYDAQGLRPTPDDRIRWVGTPRMSALTRALANNHQLLPRSRIIALERNRDGWLLYNAEDRAFGPFQHVVVAVPAHQAEPLLNHSPTLAKAAAQCRMTPCWSAAVTLAQPLRSQVSAVYSHRGPLRWAANNSSKPQRKNPQSWVLHAAPSWTQAHLESAPHTVGEQLAQALFELLGESAEVIASHTHRWRYALTSTPLGRPYLLDDTLQLSACGDWCLGNTVESAWRSGQALGLALRARWTPPTGARPSLSDVPSPAS